MLLTGNVMTNASHFLLPLMQLHVFSFENELPNHVMESDILFNTFGLGHHEAPQNVSGLAEKMMFKQ